ncbi:MAG: hypothetical protein Q4C03_06440 [bacterium]|nr:hypothetical protein [bacterium]
MVRSSIASRTSDSEPSGSFYGEASRPFAISKNTHTIPQSHENLKRNPLIDTKVPPQATFLLCVKSKIETGDGLNKLKMLGKRLFAERVTEVSLRSDYATPAAG